MNLVFWLSKAKAANPGEIRTRKDGRKWKKVGKKWVVVSEHSKVIEQDKATSQNYFDHALTTNLGDAVIEVLGQHGVTDFDSLLTKIREGTPDTAHKIYKNLFDHINTMPGTPVEKQAALHLMGTSLIKLKNQFVDQMKVKKTVSVKSKTGKVYRSSKVSSINKLPTIKPTEILRAKKLMGGWPVTTELSTAHVRSMLKTKAATLISGKIDPRKKWVMPVKAEDMETKYSGDSLIAHVKQVKKVDQRTRATAKVAIKIPYAFAKAFLLKHIESVKTRNNFIFRMEHSKGYRDYLEKVGGR